jgi:hypothetical protein
MLELLTAVLIAASLPAPPSQPPLLTLAKDARFAGHVWAPGRPLSEARNAHVTNTPAEMRAALEGDYNFFEGDVRVRSLNGHRRAVMAHDVDQKEFLTLEEWVAVGVASGRGLKLDIKEGEALDEIAVRIAASRLPQERLILNFSLDQFPPERVRALRAAFPRAVFALNPKGGHGDQYTPEQLDDLVAYTWAYGGPTIYPLRVDAVTAPIVARLEPHGDVAIWNTPQRFAPADLAEATRKLRAMGVTSMIDLRQ